MSFAFVVMMALLCSSVAIAFILQPPKEDDAAPRDSNSRCHGESLLSIRKELLTALNLQVEPRLPEGAIEQWSSIAERMKAWPVSSSDSVSADDGSISGCCTVTSEVLMRDLSWDTWMIFPDRVTVVQCAPCSPHTPCHPPQPDAQGADLQILPSCCQPTSYEDVPVCYRDELDTVVITSMHLPRRCGCSSAAAGPPQLHEV